jgi:hypothetical protein
LVPGSKPDEVFSNLMSVEGMKKWVMGGACSKAIDVTSSPPNVPNSTRCVLVEKETTLTGTVMGLWSVLDTKTDEFIRFEVSQIFYADETTTKKELCESPTLKYKCDFNLFVDDSGSGVEVIRNTFDFEQNSSIPIFMGAEVSDENYAMVTHWGK